MSLFRWQVRFGALVMVAMVCGSPLLAGTIWNTFGPGDTVNNVWSVTSPGAGTLIEATRFTPSASASLTSIMGNWGSIQTSGTFTVSLWTNSTGSPGAQLESWSLSPTSTRANYTLTPTLTHELSSAESYWVLFVGTFTDGKNLQWGSDNSAPAGGIWTGSEPSNLSQAFPDGILPALRVEGDESGPGEPGTIPEPSVAVLLLSGLVGVAALRHRLTRP